MKKIALLLGIITLMANTSLAQEDKTVTLTVSGQGKTQDEAKQNALRNAIEQTFGTFISSNTEILNDELVKDEIVSVSNGNIQEFEIISEVQIPNGDFATTLKATVSVSRLTSFIESKGEKVEFKGSILAANVKQQMLNEQNEIKSIGNIVGTCKEILDLSFDFSIVRGVPKQQNNDNNIWAVPININVKFNKNIEQFNQYFLSSIKAIAMSKDEVSQYNQLGKKTYKIALGKSKIAGRTKDIKFLRSLAASNTNLSYRVHENKKNYYYTGETKVLFESDDINKINKEFKKLNKKGRGTYKIEYNDKTINPIYHFRSKLSVVSIIDLILYTKHSVLNFAIYNGIDEITPEKLLTDLRKAHILKVNRKFSTEYYLKNNGFKIINDNLSPIFNRRCSSSYSGKITNGPNGIFWTNINACDDKWGLGVSSLWRNRGRGMRINFYEDQAEKGIGNFYYQGRIEASPGFKLDSVYNTKYGFLYVADRDLIGKNKDGSPKWEKNGFRAVISLFDFKVDGNNVITLYYEDILTLADIEKVQEYKISPIKSKSNSNPVNSNTSTNPSSKIRIPDEVEKVIPPPPPTPEIIKVVEDEEEIEETVIESTEIDEEETDENTPESKNIQLAIITDPNGTTNVRSGMGTNNPVIYKLKTNEIFNVYLNSNRWWLVELSNKQKGYIFYDRVSLIRNDLDGKYTKASNYFLNDSELNGLSKDDLKIMRNEIFARYGFIFQEGGKMNNYFKNEGWYKPKLNNVDSKLTQLEKYNIRLIKNYETGYD